MVDAHIHQEVARPQFNVNVDRAKAQQLGLTQRDVAQSMLISLSGSYMAAPNQWLNPATGINYNVTVQTPQSSISSLDAMQATPVNGPQNIQTNAKDTHLLANLAKFSRSTSPALISHYNVQPVFDILCDVDLRDLGGVARDVQKILDEETGSGKLPRGSWLVMRGQAETMHSSFVRLGLGHRLRGDLHLPADGSQLPVMARSVYYSDGAARRLRRHFVDAICRPDNFQCSFHDGYNHGNRRRDRE